MQKPLCGSQAAVENSLKKLEYQTVVSVSWETGKPVKQ